MAARIRETLSSQRMQQQELARAIEMDPTALSRALSGQRVLKSVELALIA